MRVAWLASNCPPPESKPQKDRCSVSHALCSSILRPPLRCSFDPLLSPKYQSIHSFDSLPLLVKFVHKLHLSVSLRYFCAKTGSSSLTLPFSFHPPSNVCLGALQFSHARLYFISFGFPRKGASKEADVMCPIRLGSQSSLNSLSCHNARYRNTL